MNRMPDPMLVSSCEYSLMAALLLHPQEALQRMEGAVEPGDFENMDAGTVYRILRERTACGESLDDKAVFIEAERRGAPVDQTRAVEAIRMFATLETVAEQAAYVHEAALARATTVICDELRSGSIGRSEAVERISALSAAQSSSVHDPLQAAYAYLNWIDELCRHKTESFVRTGSARLDSLFGGGFMKGGLYTFAARPGVGKTTVALNLADRIAACGHSVLYVSLEMTELQLWVRRISRESGIPFTEICQGLRTDDDSICTMTAAAQKLSQLPLRILDRPSSVEDIAEEAARSPTDLIVVDHIGLLNSRRGVPLYEQTTENSHKLKRLALSRNIPVLCLCQMNRESVKRDAHAPSLTDLKQSGAIEEDSDAVCFLIRETMAEGEVQPIGFQLEKNRHASTGLITMDFAGATARLL